MKSYILSGSYKQRNFWIMIGADSALILFSYYFSYYLRFDGNITQKILSQIVSTFYVVWLAKLVIFFSLKIYKGMYRYISISGLENLLLACFSSSIFIVFIFAYESHFKEFARSVFIIDFLLTFILLGGFRIAIRLYYQKKENGYFVPFFKVINDGFKRLLIIGAGDAGEKTLREIQSNPRLLYRVVGFIDDDDSKKGRSIHEVSVLGGIDSLKEYVDELQIDEIVIAVPSATGEQMRRIVSACEKTNVPYKTIPGIGELINGKVSVKAIRDVNYQDLLGRPSVKLDKGGISEYLKLRTIMVTGAGGSIGSELCRQIARFHPKEIILFDASEPNLYKIEMEFKHRIGFQKVVPILGGVQNGYLVEKVIERYRPEVVFHAAAYKHVPLIETNPWQGVLNNILGTQTVIRACIESHHVSHFVLVSTDKAVRPTNVMGASKRICELISQAYLYNGTKVISVRFGNVVGSAGSVVPLFRDQIERGGPITITHPEVTRYFMTIPEATQLILQAGALGNGGEIFILEMGTPVKIADMARDLIRLSGREPDRDIEIVFTGLRPGEKLYEELITEGEGIIQTEHDKIMVLKPNGGWNGYGNQNGFKSWLLNNIEELYELARIQDGNAIKKKMHEIVPEYQPQNGETIV